MSAAQPPAPFDWTDLERRFQEATPLPGGVAPGDRSTAPCISGAAADANGVAAGDAAWWDHFHAHLAARPAPRWFYSVDQAPAWFAAHWPALTAQWVRLAERQLTDLTHSDFRPGRQADGEIDWGANPTRSMNWAGFHYWSWANPLIRAYGLTGDERFAAEFARHLRSYFDQLDRFTPQLWEGADPAARDWRDWVTFNDLSAGIKMATFTEAVAVLCRAGSWTAADLRRTTLILVRLAERLHGTYAGATHPADFVRTYNFLTSGAAGLGCVATLFPECAWSPAWMSLARAILEAHLTELYYPDGGHRELCTQYHKTGIRDTLFLEQFLAAQGQGYFLEHEPYRSRLLAVIRWLTAVLMPDGSTAVLNSAAAADDWLVFVIVANRRLNDPELAWHARRWFTPQYVPRQKVVPALCSRILGQGDAPDPAAPSRAPQRCSVLLPDSGVAVLRDGWDRWASAMVVDFGRPVGGHAYPARGSFSLYLRGRPAAVSPGSPHAYTDPDYRGWMHTSRSQNNVLLDELDQEQWEVPGVRRVHGEIRRWEERADGVLVQGVHDGYLANAGVRHTRTVLMVPGRFFLVHDRLDARLATVRRAARWSIHCPEPLREGEDRRVVADGLLRVACAWPESVEAVELGHEGKVVWPAADESGMADAHRRAWQARWRLPVEPGAEARFLMLIEADAGPPARIAAAEERAGELAVDVDVDGLRDTFCLPLDALPTGR